MKKTDCTMYSEKAFLQLLKGNKIYQQAIATKNDFSEVVKAISNFCIFTDNQIDFVKQKQWD